MITAQQVKDLAKTLGADAVSIAPIERFEGAPIQMDPRQIMPEAKSVIAMAFRVFRGSWRGIEEGTFFSNYSSMGYGGLTYLYIPLTVINLCKFIEDDGWEAIPYGHLSDWRGIDNEGNLKPGYSRPVAEGKAAPDVMVHLRIAAYLAGLGEIGYSKMLLTPQFGPRNRVGIIITEAELEPDPIYNGPKLCTDCKACVKACPGHAIHPEKTVKVELAGNLVEWGELDCKACDIAFRGAEPDPDGEWGYMEAHGHKNYRPSSISPFRYKPPNVFNSGQAVCGAAGCGRVCMIALEKRGVLQNKFHNKFRRAKPWTVDWSYESATLPDGETRVKDLDPVAARTAAMMTKEPD